MPWEEDGGLRFARAALAGYDLPKDAGVRLVSLSENATFVISAPEPVGVLRVYRPSYQTGAAKRSELAWIQELRRTGTVLTPDVIPTADGAPLHRVVVDDEERDCVLFEYVEGVELNEDAVETYAAVGVIAALLHLQVQAWERPEGFERLVWGIEEILGPDAHWGDWREGPNLSAAGRVLLEEAEARVRDRLAGYEFDRDNAGLVHGDLRAANVLSGPDDSLWIIDFDDSGFSWFLWDLCSSTTLIEHTPMVDDVVDSWLEGYQRVRPLSDRDLDVLVDLVFLRRLHLLAWLGSHAESDLARDIGGEYAEGTVEIATRYLAGRFLPRLASRRV